MTELLLSTTNGLDGVWSEMLRMWSDPSLRPALIAAAVMGLVLGCLLVPLCRRVWLAIKPRGTTRTRD